ncbi:hypothetical protein Syncc8109_2023 [Synechococcus sp. WH 8109]|uniref:hypothetical protein n=1 Tax=Synechococcus sp. WH 8109 TaxID=166314 RepID=UPI0001B8E181|nr:hypothetical protein [Synechococcus sp. WH 8109]AHF64366.1 hypothetical protein Syncc8109_2023 [Synechococcus sp. WH 8109]
MELHWLFLTPVLQVDLEPNAATAAAMQQQLEQSMPRCISTLSSPIATTSPGICWAMPAWISCIAWMRSSG